MRLMCIVAISFLTTVFATQDYCQRKGGCDSDVNNEKYTRPKYLLYSVNRGEGFNLRRDVYIRMASLVKMLGKPWSLVLPPFESMYHWRRSQHQIFEWKQFFDTKQMGSFVDIIEFADYYNIQKDSETVDLVLSFRYFKDFDNLNDRYEIVETCNDTESFVRNQEGKFVGLMGSYILTAKKFICVNILGTISTVHEIISEKFSNYNSILVEHSEIVLHHNYGDKIFWDCRRSMVFAKHLIALANIFMLSELDSDFKLEKNKLYGRERDENINVERGNYLAVHLRRADFMRSRPKDVPDLDCALQQIKSALYSTQLSTVFIATDCSETEWQQLSRLAAEAGITLHRYQNDNLSDGEVAIVDQVIASKGRFFIGTYDSTFSFRIQEEREILGQPSDSTFNAFCASCEGVKSTALCKQQSTWKVVL